ncbi:hypothetical protein [Streptomyces sp. NPDC051561]|uniref:hypothetical protein n=1 Tax=Streptomyces sp. NPDC051561 TaxID=3365658 RepID=UPI0037BC1889
MTDDIRASIRRAMTTPNHMTPETADRQLDAYAADVLRAAAQHLRVHVWGPLYDEDDHDTAAGVSQAATALDDLAANQATT